MSTVAILGAGSWGTALAVLWHDLHPRLWDHDGARARTIARSRRSERFLPGVALPAEITLTSSLGDALRDARTVVLAVPSHALRPLARDLAATSAWPPDVPVICASKGLEQESGKRPSQVLTEELPQAPRDIVVLAGPSHAEEVARGVPTSVVLAGPEEGALPDLQERFSTASFRIYTNNDLLGVELAVAMKNVIAIAAGISDGLGFGDNTKGALLTRGLAEMTRLGLALGARSETFAGLAGLGDLITTAISRHSRNRNLGERLGRGETLQEATRRAEHVAEGVRTTAAALGLAHKAGVELPITQQVHDILFADKNPRQAIRDLMLRTPKSEVSSSQKGAS